MKILFCCESNNHTWSRGCEDITYRKTNIKVSGDKYHYALTFSYEFNQQNDTTYFAHSAPYTFTMLDRFLLTISNSIENRLICKRKTLAESPGGNYVDMLIISNFRK
jgi:cytosolic carboxypeptidase protein 2/3